MIETKKDATLFVFLLAYRATEKTAVPTVFKTKLPFVVVRAEQATHLINQSNKIPRDTHPTNYKNTSGNLPGKSNKKTTGYPPHKSNKNTTGYPSITYTHSPHAINERTHLSQEVIFADVRIWQSSHDVKKTLNHFLLRIDHSKVKSTVGRHSRR